MRILHRRLPPLPLTALLASCTTGRFGHVQVELGRETTMLTNHEDQPISIVVTVPARSMVEVRIVPRTQLR